MRLVLLAFNVDVVKLSSTPLQVLVVVLILAAIAAFGFFLFTIVGAPFVDKRWPADEPLNPIEMLWGESGGYIQRTFRGLDLGVSKDLASQFQEVKYKAGDTIIEQGEPATHFYVVKDGNVEVSQTVDTGTALREDVINQFGPGQSFGETAILRRSARTASVRALSDCTVLELSAEDFVAGAALSAAEDNELLARVDTYMQADAARATSAKGSAGIGFLARRGSRRTDERLASDPSCSRWRAAGVRRARSERGGDREPAGEPRRRRRRAAGQLGSRHGRERLGRLGRRARTRRPLWPIR